MLRESCSDVVSFVFRAQSHELGTMIEVPTVVEEKEEAEEAGDDDEDAEYKRGGANRQKHYDDGDE